MLQRDRLVQVFLHGALGEQFGWEHAFAITTPREAVRALDVNFPGFRAAMLQHQRYGLFVDGDWRDSEDAAVLPISQHLHIVPIIEGRGPLLAPVILAAAPWLGAIGSEIVAGLIVSALLWGVSQLFFKPPEVSDAEKTESYIFSGMENTTAQGAAVPVIYGRGYVGSVVISAGISVGDQQIKGRSGREALTGFNADPQDVAAPFARHTGPGVGGAMPPLALQEVRGIGSGIFRVGPEGWRHVGTVSLLDGAEHRELDVFVPPDAGLPYRWDYWRGFERYQPGEQGMLGA